MTMTNGKLAVRLIRLTNIGGIEDTLEIPLGDITYLEGTNGVGKSSAVDGLAALCGGPVADLLNQNAAEGEVYLELTDDTWFRRRITRAGGNTLTAGHPDQGSIGKAAAWLKATLSVAALSPAEFLGADDTKAAEYILRTAPLTVTPAEIAEATGVSPRELPPGEYGGHALTVLDRVVRALYDERTGENRTEKNAKATSEQLARSIPDGVQDPEELAGRVNELRAALDGITEEREAARAEAGRVARDQADDDLRAVAANLNAIGDRIAEKRAELARVTAALGLDIAERTHVEDLRESIMREREVRAAAAERDAGAPFQALLATESANLSAAKIAHGVAAKAAAAIQNTRDMVAHQEAAAKAAHARSAALTQSMARVEALKAAKAAGLPIAGVTIEDGKLRIGGVPAHRANTAERVRVAIDASTAQEARLRFVFADDLEHLATKTRREVERACRERGIQILGARVTDDEQLIVRTEETV